MIDGAVLRKLKVIPDERGHLFEILRPDWPEFISFGQVYATAVKPGWVKAWHYHKKQHDNFCVIRGRGRIVLYDPRENSPTKGAVEEHILSAEEPHLLRIPPGVLHGFESAGPQECWILNVPTHPYRYEEPDEYRVPLGDPSVPYNGWTGKQGW